MYMLEVLGFSAAVLMGLSLGLIGGGGSILTVPILVYLFGLDAVPATAYSLFVVGLTSGVGSISHFQEGNVHLRLALIFGAPAILAVFVVRKYLLPAMPEVLLVMGEYSLTKSAFLLMLFALMMVITSLSMIFNWKKSSGDFSAKARFNYPLILSEGVVVGGITGLVGAGGGFLIIPALVFLAKIPMKQAIGTSLLIIALKSLLGFLGDVGAGTPVNYPFMLLFSGIAMLGILAGTYLTRFIPNEHLKPAFGWFVLLMGAYMVLKEIGIV
jgi:uncharacterized protein